MIIKSFELDKLIFSSLSVHLIYGNNEGIKQDIISNFYTSLIYNYYKIIINIL